MFTRENSSRENSSRGEGGGATPEEAAAEGDRGEQPPTQREPEEVWRVEPGETGTPAPTSAATHSNRPENHQTGEKEGDGGDNGGGRERRDGGRDREPCKEKISFLFTNCQSLQSKVPELEAVSTDLKPDVILL